MRPLSPLVAAWVRNSSGAGDWKNVVRLAGRFGKAQARALAAGGGNNQDPHSVLGVKPGASMDEIKKAYKKKALQWHPDRAEPSKRKAHEEEFRKINAAYSELVENGGKQSSQHQSGPSSSAEWSNRWQQQQQWQKRGPFDQNTGFSRPGSSGFSNADAERVFKEFFGSRAAEDLFREMHRAAEEMHRGRRSGFGMGMDFGPQEWEQLVRNRMGGSGGPHATEVQEYTYRRGDGKHVRRRVTRRHMPNGNVHEETQEEVLDDHGRPSDRSTDPGPFRSSAGSSSSSPMGSSAGGPLAGPHIASALYEMFRRTVVPVLAMTVTRAIQSAFRGALRSVLRRLLGGGRR